MTTDTVELVTGLQGRWLGKRGIFCHTVPGIEDVDLNGEEGVHHVMVTSVAGAVVGWLIRWAWEPGEISYEVRINGTEEHAGMSDVAAYSIDTSPTWPRSPTTSGRNGKSSPAFARTMFGVSGHRVGSQIRPPRPVTTLR
jgi:hypothetical protein